MATFQLLNHILEKLTTENLVRPDLPFTTRIVLPLAQQVLNKAEGSGYHLYKDSFYTSIPPATELHSQNIHLTETIQKNRVGLPIEVKKLKLKNLETKVFRHSDNKMTLA